MNQNNNIKKLQLNKANDSYSNNLVAYWCQACSSLCNVFCQCTQQNPQASLRSTLINMNYAGGSASMMAFYR